MSQNTTQNILQKYTGKYHMIYCEIQSNKPQKNVMRSFVSIGGCTLKTLKSSERTLRFIPISARFTFENASVQTATFQNPSKSNPEMLNRHDEYAQYGHKASFHKGFTNYSRCTPPMKIWKCQL